jgi:MFS transporter, AAHS family, 4-hydroxybenzoate transporter
MSRYFSSAVLPAIAACSLATFVDGYDVQALGLTIPLMAQEFGVAPPAFALAASVSLVGMALGALFLSPLADRHGQRRLLVSMLTLFGVATLAASFSSSITFLSIARFFAGLGLGATLPVALALTARLAPEARRNAILSLVVAATALGAFFAGLIAPAVIEAWGWRGVYWVGAAAPVAVAALTIAVIPRDEPILDRSIPLRSGGLFAATVLLEPGLRARTLVLWLVFLVNQFVAYALITWMPTLLIEAGFAAPAALRATGLLALGGIVGSVLISVTADRGHSRAALAAAYLLGTAGLALAGLGQDTPVSWLLCVLLTGIGVYGAQMGVGALVASYYPGPLRATGIGWASGIGRLGSILGPLVLGGLLAGSASPSSVLAYLIGPVLLCGVCVRLLPDLPRSKGVER